MREHLPDWLKQIVDGLGKGKNWVISGIQGLPLSVRMFGWLVFQAILFKLQPELWSGLVTVFGLFGGVMALEFRTQLLLIVISFLSFQTTIFMLKLNSLETVVQDMSAPDTPEQTVTDGGHNVVEIGDDDGGSSGIGAIGGAVTGAALGSSFGPAGAIGGAILGAMLGDEYEQGTQTGKDERR